MLCKVFAWVKNEWNYIDHKRSEGDDMLRYGNLAALPVFFSMMSCKTVNS